jgi:transposase-like protein
MIDFPITELMDDAACLVWLERHLHPSGFVCPHCRSSNRRLFRATQAFPAYRCRNCNGYYTILTDTAFEKTRQRPATIVLLLRGVAQGETSERLSRELGISYNQVLTLRHRLQDNANETAPMNQMQGTHFESDEVYQNAGEKRRRTSRPA